MATAGTGNGSVRAVQVTLVRHDSPAARRRAPRVSVTDGSCTTQTHAARTVRRTVSAWSSPRPPVQVAGRPLAKARCARYVCSAPRCRPVHRLIPAAVAPQSRRSCRASEWPHGTLRRRPEQEADMTTSPSDQGMNASTTSPAGGRGRIALIMIAAIVFVVAAIVGAYLNWIWWAYDGWLMIILAAGAILLVGGILALIGRGIVRRIALVVLAVGIGLVAGQSLGPIREPAGELHEPRQRDVVRRQRRPEHPPGHAGSPVRVHLLRQGGSLAGPSRYPAQGRHTPEHRNHGHARLGRRQAIDHRDAGHGVVHPGVDVQQPGWFDPLRTPGGAERAGLQRRVDGPRRHARVDLWRGAAVTARSGCPRQRRTAIQPRPGRRGAGLRSLRPPANGGGSGWWPRRDRSADRQAGGR